MLSLSRTSAFGSSGWASSAGWLNALAGLWLVVVSVVMLIVGKYASVSLRKMESALADEEAVRAAFARAHDRLCAKLPSRVRGELTAR